jgi:hypothetical protein
MIWLHPCSNRSDHSSVAFLPFLLKILSLVASSNSMKLELSPRLFSAETGRFELLHGGVAR